MATSRSEEQILRTQHRLAPGLCYHARHGHGHTYPGIQPIYPRRRGGCKNPTGTARDGDRRRWCRRRGRGRERRRGEERAGDRRRGLHRHAHRDAAAGEGLRRHRRRQLPQLRPRGPRPRPPHRRPRPLRPPPLHLRGPHHHGRPGQGVRRREVRRRDTLRRAEGGRGERGAPGDVQPQQHRRHRQPLRRHEEARLQQVGVLLVGDRVRPAGEGPLRRGLAPQGPQPLRQDQAVPGGDAAGLPAREPGVEDDPAALLQPHRRARERRHRGGPQGRPQQSAPLHPAGGRRPPPGAQRLRPRLPHPRRHRRPGLHPRRRPRRRPHRLSREALRHSRHRLRGVQPGDGARDDGAGDGERVREGIRQENPGEDVPEEARRFGAGVRVHRQGRAGARLERQVRDRGDVQGPVELGQEEPLWLLRRCRRK